MAIRRMLSKKIIDTDAFMDMPLSSQALYMHLVLNADDDGFVGSPKKVMRSIGCMNDDIKILLGKRFILDFESGVVVIKHWKIHNLIRLDRYTKTTYQKELSLLGENDNKSYTIKTDVIPNGNQMGAEVSLDKLSLDKLSLDKPIVVAIPYKAIVDVLNKKMGSRFSFNTTDTRTKIKARWNERLKDKKSPDVIFKEFILCINNAYEYWNKKNNLNFVRPKTLFNGDMENRVNGRAYNWEERTVGKNLLPKDIEIDWLDDYLKNRGTAKGINMGDKNDYCKAYNINYNDLPSDEIIFKWTKERNKI